MSAHEPQGSVNPTTKRVVAPPPRKASATVANRRASALAMTSLPSGVQQPEAVPTTSSLGKAATPQPLQSSALQEVLSGRHWASSATTSLRKPSISSSTAALTTLTSPTSGPRQARGSVSNRQEPVAAETFTTVGSSANLISKHTATVAGGSTANSAAQKMRTQIHSASIKYGESTTMRRASVQRKPTTSNASHPPDTQDGVVDAARNDGKTKPSSSVVTAKLSPVSPSSLENDEEFDDDDNNDDDNEAGGGVGDGDDEGDEDGGAVEDVAAINEMDIAFTQKLAKDEPIRTAPEVVVRPLLTPYVWQSVTPFPHRQNTIVFPPADSPWEGDAQANVSSAYVTPGTLDPMTTAEGVRKRIGRKGKFGDLIYDIPEGSVRFSSVLAIFGSAGLRERGDPDDDGPHSWSMKWTKRVEFEEYKALHPMQKVNHFPGNWGIGRKDNLHRHLTKCAQRFGPNIYNFHPGAWLLPQERDALARDMAAADCPPQGMHKNVYIIKQVASACGRRMRLLCNGKPPKGKWLVQRYIHDPLLIYGYKFDLRLYVVVTSYVPLRVYLYDEGLVRFATTPYPKPQNGKGMKVTSSTAHLTNYSINKSNTEAFVNPDDAGGDDDERGSKWVLSTVRRYFASKGWDWATMWKKVEDVIIKTLLAIETDVAQQMRTAFGPLNPSGVNNCFELYGFDVLIRENFEPVLMEVNIMPSLSTRCSLLDQRVKANMIAEMLTLVGAYSMEKKPLSKKSKDKKLADTVKMHPFFATLTAAELEAVCQCEEENLRRTHYTRLFPTADAHDVYKPLFREVKSLNTLLCAWEKAKLVDVPSWITPSTQTASVFSLDPKPSGGGGNGMAASQLRSEASRGDDAEDSDDDLE